MILNLMEMIFINNTNQFLSLFHGSNKIHFRVINNSKSINLYDTYEAIQEQLNYYNDNGYDIYFTVNSGGTKQTEINKINAVFIDLDCGKDNNKNYYPLEYVSKYKTEQLQRINSFTLKPSAIVETRNGLHAYWILKDNCSIDDYLKCMQGLIDTFNSDKAVKTVERVMRIPNYNWCKGNHDKFKCKLLDINDNTYTIDDIINILNIKVEDKGKSGEIRINTNNTYLSSPEKPYQSEIHIQAIKNGDIELLQALIKPIPLELDNENEFYEYITQQIDLNEFLGVGYKKFKCIFHSDNKPSAGIFITERGQYFYKCHSSDCGFMGNIIRCVERLRRCNRPQAINFIKEVYKLSIKEGEWQQEQKKLLNENKRMLLSGEFKESYPQIHKIIKNYMPLLNIIHDIAIDNVYDEKYSDNDKNAVFYASVQKIHDAMGNKGSRGKISDRIGLFAFLLLVKKLKEENIPENYLKRAKHIAAKNNHKNLVSFYSIPSYSDEQLLKSLERAIQFKDSNITMTGWTRELLQRTFGDDIANEIYPMFKHRKLTKKSIVRTEHIHKITLSYIEKQGYAIEKDILNELVIMYTGMNQKFSKEQLHKQIKKSLQEMLDTYGWSRIRLNKKTKEILNIDPFKVEGFPFVIVNVSNDK